MSLIDQAKALLGLAAQRTRGPLRADHSVRRGGVYLEPATRRKLFVHINNRRDTPPDDDAAYLVAIWDLAEVLAREYITQSEMIAGAARALSLCHGTIDRTLIRALDAEHLLREVMTAGLAAVEQARREERASAVRILGRRLDYSKDQGSICDAIAEIRARGT